MSLPAPKARILVVDDEPSVVLLCQYVLEEAGYAVDCATQADEASALIQTRRYDVLLIDLVMPHAGGLSVIRTARAAAADTPVVVMTAEPEHRVPRRAGIDHYLHKPFDGLDALEAVIARALQARAPAAAPSAAAS